MKNQQLFDYVKNQLQQNISKDKIRKNLLENDWSEEDIREAFSGLNSGTMQSENINTSLNINSQENEVSAETSKKPMTLIISVILGIIIFSGGALGYFHYFQKESKAEPSVDIKNDTTVLEDIEELKLEKGISSVYNRNHVGKNSIRNYNIPVIKKNTPGSSAGKSLFLVGLDRDTGKAGDRRGLKIEGLKSSNDVVIFLGTKEIIPDTIIDDFSIITFTVPVGSVSGELRVKHNNIESNAIFFNVKLGTVDPPQDKIVFDHLGNPISIDAIFVSLFDDNNTRNEANRLAEIVSGEVIGRIEMINMWQIRVNATSVDELEAIGGILELENTVNFTFIDSGVKGGMSNGPV